MRSKDIVFYKNCKAEIVEHELEELKEDEVRIRADLSLITSGSEISQYIGKFDPKMHWVDQLKYPRSMGYALAGEVLDAGSGVTRFKPGDRVYAQTPHKHISNVKEERLTLLPDDISNENAVWTPMLRVAEHAVRVGGVQLGSTVVVMGLGIFGQCVVQYARLAGAKTIIAVDPIPYRTQMAKKMGATHVLTCKGEDAVKEVSDLTGEKMGEIVFEVSGQCNGVEVACNLAGKFSKVILIGDTPEISRQIVGTNILTSYLSIHGIHINMNVMTPNAFYPLSNKDIHDSIYEYMRQKRLEVNSLVTHRISPMEAPGMFARLVRDRSFSLGILIDWTKLNEFE